MLLGTSPTPFFVNSVSDLLLFTRNSSSDVLESRTYGVMLPSLWSVELKDDDISSYCESSKLGKMSGVSESNRFSFYISSDGVPSETSFRMVVPLEYPVNNLVAFVALLPEATLLACLMSLYCFK